MDSVSHVLEREETLVSPTADIVAAHFSKNSVSVSHSPVLIQNVHGALAGLGSGTGASDGQRPEPALSVRSSVKPDYLICLMRVGCALPEGGASLHPREG